MYKGTPETGKGTFIYGCIVAKNVYVLCIYNKTLYTGNWCNVANSQYT